MAVPESELLRSVSAPWVAAGRDCVSISAIPPGAYRLRVELDDGRRFEREVELRERETTAVVLGP